MSLVKARLANTGNTLKPSPTQSTGTSATERVSEWWVIKHAVWITVDDARVSE